MASSCSDQCMTQFNNAIRYPLRDRCSEIRRIVEVYSCKELHNIFPLLVGDIFGITCKIDWGLRSIFNSFEHNDYDIVLWFFGCEGPLFNMCYKLMSNNFYLKYEFPLAFLPVSVRKMIEDGLVSNFYSKFLKIDSQTGKPTSLSLNPFEFYIFHFAYHLVNPCIQRGTGTIDQWDTAYHQLADNYVSYFLPLERNKTVPPVVGFYMTKSSTPMQTTNRPVRLPTLFRQSVLVSQSNTSGSLHGSPNSSLQNAWLEIWRSELVAQVFLDFWFSSNSREANKLMNRSSFLERYSLPSAPSISVNQSMMSTVPDLHQPNSLTFCYPQLPSMEHIRIVRNYLKHVHYFAQSFENNGTAMDELKRLIIPSSQAKIYTFLRHTIDQWPLDSSFRLILETWLSYIQPWRYVDPSERWAPVEREERERVVEVRWLGFIAENLLAYTVVFRQLLNRFARLDLSTPKNATMVFRLAKVFSQTNLCPMIAEVESCMDETITTTTLPHKWTALIRQQVIDLEGPGYHYTPMFGQQTEIEMRRFMYFVRESLRVSEELLLEEQMEANKTPKSFFASVFGIFTGNDEREGDYSLEDRKRVVVHLKTAIDLLSPIFKIEIVDSSVPVSPYTSVLNGNHTFSDTFGPTGALGYQPQQPDVSTMRTPIRASPKAMQEHVRQIRYEGDPDLEPIRSTESTLLVRLLYQVTSKLNEMYSMEMANYYYREGIVGRVARQILCPPKTIRRYDKSIPGNRSPRVESTLPPRLSLRSLASYRFLVYYSIALFVAYMFGYSPSSFTLILVAAWALFVFIYALVSPILPNLNRFPSEVHNLSTTSSMNSSGHADMAT